MQKENEYHQRYGYPLLNQFAHEVGNRAFNQGRAVIGGNDTNPVGESALQFGQLGLYPADNVQGVFAVPHDDDAGNRFAGSVQFHDAPAQGRSFDNAGHIGQGNRRAVLRVHHDLLKVEAIFHVPGGSDHELALALLQHPSPHFTGGRCYGLGNTPYGNVVGAQFVGIDQHLVFAHEPAHRGDFRDSVNPCQLETQEPVLQRTKLGQVRLSRFIHQGVLVNPTHSGRVRTDLRGSALGQLRAQARQRLDHSRTSPVEVHVVFEDYIHKAGAEHGRTAHVLGFWQAEQIRRKRIGHQVLDDLWRLARKLGANDDLRVSQIRNGVQGRSLQGQPASQRQPGGKGKNDDRVGCRPGNQSRDGRSRRIGAGQALYGRFRHV